MVQRTVGGKVVRVEGDFWWTWKPRMVSPTFMTIGFRQRIDMKIISRNKSKLYLYFNFTHSAWVLKVYNQGHQVIAEFKNIEYEASKELQDLKLKTPVTTYATKLGQATKFALSNGFIVIRGKVGLHTDLGIDMSMTELNLTAGGELTLNNMDMINFSEET